MSDMQALIEEARQEHAGYVDIALPGVYLCSTCRYVRSPCVALRLADALEASEARVEKYLSEAELLTEERDEEYAARNDLTGKIERLAARWTAMASIRHEPLSDYDYGSSVGLQIALEDCARELRGLISGDAS